MQIGQVGRRDGVVRGPDFDEVQEHVDVVEDLLGWRAEMPVTSGYVQAEGRLGVGKECGWTSMWIDGCVKFHSEIHHHWHLRRVCVQKWVDLG